ENLRLAAAFLEQVRNPQALKFGPAVAVAAALRHRLDAAGVVHARTYDSNERRYGFDVAARVPGIRIGGEFSRTHQDTRLVAATTRGRDGVWRERSDCLART